MKICRICKRLLPEYEFYPCNLSHRRYICRDCSTKSRKPDENYNVGGWKIIILNHVKCNEYRFQAYNTVTGEFLKANEREEIKRMMLKIFERI